jgi:ferredoxin
VGAVAYRIAVDRQKCQGIGACVGAAPDVFEIDKEGKAVVIDPQGADTDTIILAAEACPLEARTVFDEEGEQVYP